MSVTTITYDLALGNDTIEINDRDFPTRSTKVSLHVQGDGNVDGTVTVQLQETNVHGSGQKAIAGATAVANVSTSEYVDDFVVGGAFMDFTVVLGTATAGIISIIIRTE